MGCSWSLHDTETKDSSLNVPEDTAGVEWPAPAAESRKVEKQVETETLEQPPAVESSTAQETAKELETTASTQNKSALAGAEPGLACADELASPSEIPPQPSTSSSSC
mmetsp:Transcript_24772/g.65019  ORF Transcript_24772/g.65019 Transcript_24772/m.65019 type:complete len:108 (-) Transcript_24772:456-779(-)|eukprot:CAMPEP_0194502960 /NCGR_PEP_ID=MMETSP0253-20130528/27781_1 /TAXON_ID=2966 /ORGANISM="Noctiluca scintillans" /LENGTH=107 /DNA_ID=CAMNT_0039345189 /DNA_START=50 /DNA_END=373 /DNA_ORIENTATION=+